jgi:lysophospholipase L1-like esterase
MQSSIEAQGANKRPIGKTLQRFLVLFIMLLCAAGGYYYFFLNRPIGNGPAGPAVPLESFKHPWTEKPVLLVGLGDSVTAGFGARKQYSYFDRLVANPPDEFEGMKAISLSTVLPKLSVTNLSVSGSTSFEHVEKQLSRLPRTDSNTVALIVLTTGGNDLIHNYGRTAPNERAMYGASMEEARPWIADFDKRIETMLNHFETSFPGGYHVFLADIFDPTDGVGDIQRAGLPAWKDGLEILKAYNEVLHNFARRHPQVHLVPVHDAFLGHGIHCAQFWSAHYDSKDPHYWYYVNLEDPNERGYDVVRRLFLNEMIKISDRMK